MVLPQRQSVFVRKVPDSLIPEVCKPRLHRGGTYSAEKASALIFRHVYFTYLQEKVINLFIKPISFVNPEKINRYEYK